MASAQERILSAAVQLFAKNGFHSTATKQIARLAKVNEATVFRKHPKKDDLIRASIEWKISKCNEEIDRAMVFGEDDTPQKIARTAMGIIYDKFFGDPELGRLLMFIGLEGNPAAHRFVIKTSGVRANRIFALLTTPKKRTLLRSGCNIKLLARFFDYMIMAHFIHEKVYTAENPVSRADFIDGATGIFLHGCVKN